MRVKATREGLEGHSTAADWFISPWVPAVALPSRAALWRFVLVSNPRSGLYIVARVLDVGPWNTADDAYVFGGHRPQAESGTDSRGRPTNGAGIDLSDYTWRAIAMIDNDVIDWSFVDGAVSLADARQLLPGYGTTGPGPVYGGL
jgi:hypothetical protein